MLLSLAFCMCHATMSILSQMDNNSYRCTVNALVNECFQTATKSTYSLPNTHITIDCYRLCCKEVHQNKVFKVKVAIHIHFVTLLMRCLISVQSIHTWEELKWRLWLFEKSIFLPSTTKYLVSIRNKKFSAKHLSKTYLCCISALDISSVNSLQKR